MPDILYNLVHSDGKYRRISKSRSLIDFNEHLLAPVYNCHPSKELHPGAKDHDELFEIAKEDVNKVYYLDMNLDGFNLGGCRVPIEESFPVTLGRNNIFGVNSGPTRFVSDDYWVFLSSSSLATISYGLRDIPLYTNWMSNSTLV